MRFGLRDELASGINRASDHQPAQIGGSSPVGVADRRIVLSQHWFGFILRWALRHAFRHSDYLTLVTIRASREYVGLTVDAGSQALTDLAEVIGPTIRATDLFGELADGRLGLLLSESDNEAAFRVIQRFAETLGHVRYSVSMAFAIGSACCPINGVDADGLVAHALMHPVLDVRAGPALLADLSFSC